MEIGICRSFAQNKKLELPIKQVFHPGNRVRQMLFSGVDEGIYIEGNIRLMRFILLFV